jgi:hypothetical protein
MVNLIGMIDLYTAVAIMVRNKRFGLASLTLRSTRTSIEGQKQRIYSPGTTT